MAKVMSSPPGEGYKETHEERVVSTEGVDNAVREKGMRIGARG